MPLVDLTALLDDEEANLKLRKINVMHASIMDMLGDPGNPLYAEPHSMAKHYDAMLVGARALGDLPEHTCCRDSGATARVHEDEAQQVCQKILRCLDMRVMYGDLVVLTCLRTPMLILPARRFVQLYYDPDAQGQYASHFPTGGQGFLQPRGTSECLSSPGISEYFRPMCEKSSISISIGRDWRRKRTRRVTTA